MRKLLFLYIFISAVFLLIVYCAYSSDLPKWFRFNKENSIQEWQEKIFQNKVLYTIGSDKTDGYLLAKSDKACSGLFYKMIFNTKKYPFMSWEWKVIQFPDKTKSSGAETGWIEKDDYAARVYVIFPSWSFMNTKSIEYVWDENQPEGTITTSPYFKNIKLIVAESGRKNMDNWVFEERNIYEDYKKCFGGDKPAAAGAIALMTDTDNTLSTAEALYKNIRVGYKNEK
jgi:hypothetical protein